MDKSKSDAKTKIQVAIIGGMALVLVAVIELSQPIVEKWADVFFQMSVSETPTATSNGITETSTLSISPTIVTKTITPSASFAVFTKTNTPLPPAPIIQSIRSWEKQENGELFAYKDIYFRDFQGDAETVVYELVSLKPDTAEILIGTDPISSNQGEQKVGTYVTVKWACGEQSYVVVLRTQILDVKGNKSNPKDITFDCSR
jgi:hypothetical protein